MTVVNVPANHTEHLPANTVPGLMHVYCVGPGQAEFGIAIKVSNKQPPYTYHTFSAGGHLTFQIDNLETWVKNDGPSRIQLLYGSTREGDSIADTKGATAITEAPAS